MSRCQPPAPIRVRRASLAARLLQQAAIAEFGRDALRTDDLDALLQRATELAARGLDTGFAKIVERQPDTERLLVRAGVGWRPGIVGAATLGGDLESAVGYALRTGRPVICPDLRTETRFRLPTLLQEHGIRSAVNVVIGDPAAPFGVLEVDSRRPVRFTDQDVAFIEGFASFLAAAIARLRQTKQLVALAQEKQLLLIEVQHRVKNNLQVITSLLNLQARETADAALRAKLGVVRQRIGVLALIQEQLSARGMAQELDLAEHLRRLCDSLLAFHGIDRARIGLDLQLAPVTVAVEQAVPLGLIANEVISNSLQHAFPAGRGSITVQLRASGTGHAELILADTGIGLAAPPAAAAPRLGLRLIPLLAEQADAMWQWDTNNGTKLSLLFPCAPPHRR